MARKPAQEQEPRRLYRSQRDKMIAGVCGGIAEYFNVDPVWIRLATVLIVFVNGIGLLLYILAWILIPKNPYQKPGEKTIAEDTVERAAERIASRKERRREGRHEGHIFAGLLLIILGALFLFKNLFSWFSWAYVGPAIIIALGLYLIARRAR